MSSLQQAIIDAYKAAVQSNKPVCVVKDELTKKIPFDSPSTAYGLIGVQFAMRYYFNVNLILRSLCYETCKS